MDAVRPLRREKFSVGSGSGSGHGTKRKLLELFLIKEKQGLCRHPAGAVTAELIIHRDTYFICITSTQFVSKSRLQVQRELKDS
jgi:hypothetical protein